MTTHLDTRPPSPARGRRKTIWIAIAVVLVIGIAVGLALFQPWKIFTRNTVDEALPGTPAPVAVTAVSTTEPQVLPPTAGSAVQPPTPASTPPVDATAGRVGQTPAPPTATDPVVLASGTFFDGEHETSGTATVLQLPDGSKFVRLEGFSTSDGPDVHVALTDQQAGGDDWGKYDDGRYVELGSLKGTDGNQNYEIAADVDLTGLTSVVIWCDRFNVAFGSAPVSL